MFLQPSHLKRHFVYVVDQVQLSSGFCPVWVKIFLKKPESDMW